MYVKQAFEIKTKIELPSCRATVDDHSHTSCQPNSETFPEDGMNKYYNNKNNWTEFKQR